MKGKNENKRKMKGNQVGKEEVKPSQFANDMMDTEKILKIPPEDYKN